MSCKVEVYDQEDNILSVSSAWLLTPSSKTKYWIKSKDDKKDRLCLLGRAEVFPWEERGLTNSWRFEAGLSVTVWLSQLPDSINFYIAKFVLPLDQNTYTNTELKLRRSGINPVVLITQPYGPKHAKSKTHVSNTYS